ncbi:hypothetical protein CC86DRAFT_325055 [Ophiobolus disseminans]|uniref:Glycoside hydrolase family 93 protein n=1 Tax=Ophiobolus disseminans TaxID=1469910 RepID=A0A6A6ZVS4_9PLEO|nr:hypothetical protein CC86DRAFT_325055 [Ophiobolus disseminans]
MRFVVFILALFLFVCAVRAQWDDDPDEDPDDPEEDPPWRPTSTRRRPTSTRRPTQTRRPTPTQQPTPTRRPTPTRAPTPTPTPEDPEDPPEPIFTGVDTFANATMYQPDDTAHHLTSPRTENMPNNTVLAVWNDLEQINSTLPIYRSTNNGFSWYAHGTAKSKVAGRRLLEPHLLLAEGSFSGDTNMTLLAVNAVDAKSTNIELYASWDQGVTFEFVHCVAEGGAVGAKAVGEPHLLLHDKRLTVYYSDQRDGQHAQKISQQSAADMWDGWGTAIDVAASSTLSDQQGMASVAKLPNKQYLIAFESSPSNGTNSASITNFKITASPENAATERIRDIVSTTGVKPQGASFVTWSLIGGANGTIILSDSVTNSIFVNQALGEGPWKVVATTAGRALGREVRAPANDRRALRITGGSEGKTTSADILVSSMDLEKALLAAA